MMFGTSGRDLDHFGLALWVVMDGPAKERALPREALQGTPWFGIWRDEFCHRLRRHLQMSRQVAFGWRSCDIRTESRQGSRSLIGLVKPCLAGNYILH